MSTKRFLFLFIIGLCLANVAPIQAQDQPDNSWEKYQMEYRLFRFALVPGLSTNGIDATDYASKYSLNILAGYNGALDNGFELGGLVNANKYYSHGVQIAGLANYSGEETAGVQLAGLGSYSGDDMQGIQFAGLSNWAAEDMQGIQFSGILNFAGENSQGLQFTGGLNIARNDMQGLMGSGIGNISTGNMQGLLFSGAFNITTGDMQGIVASGGFNYAKYFQGISMAPLNINKQFQGIQVGNVNVAREGQGIQIGLINYAKEFEGVPVGLISYYGNGRTNVDTWTSETGFTNVGLKLGTEPVYNMISIGYNPLLDRDVWQVGWSIGRLHQYERHYLYTDFSYFKINEGDWTEDLNSIFKYRLLFGKELGSGFKFYGGPTLNMLISRVPESDDYTLYRLFDFEAKGRQYVFWVGCSLGIELF